jgi:hypothetical protein
LDILDRELPLPEPCRYPLSDEVLAKVKDCAYAWMRGHVLDDELDEAVVGFCYLVRLYPEHPAFDAIRDSFTRGELQAALRKIGDTYTCRFSPCISTGVQLYVVISSWNNLSYDPLYLVTLGRLEPRLKEIGEKILEEALRVICMVPVDKKQVPQYQHWAIISLINKLYNYATDFYCTRE